MWKLRAMKSMSFTVFSCNTTLLLIQPNPTQPMDGPNPCPSLFQAVRDRNFALQIKVETRILALRPKLNVCSWDRDWDWDRNFGLEASLHGLETSASRSPYHLTTYQCDLQRPYALAVRQPRFESHVPVTCKCTVCVLLTKRFRVPWSMLLTKPRDFQMLPFYYVTLHTTERMCIAPLARCTSEYEW